jgi:YbbR domain-containing protein
MATALVFGILAWTVVNMKEHFVVSLRAPVEVYDIPDGWAVSTPLPPTLEVKLRGEGWPLAGVMLGRSPRFRFSMNGRPGGTRVFQRADVADQIALPEGVVLIDLKPDSLRVDLDRAVRKRVPIDLHIIPTFRDGYGQVGPMSVSPDSVTVTGAESVLRGIRSWKTERAAFDDLKSPVEERIPLAPAGLYAVVLSVTEVKVSINVEPFAERILAGLPVEAKDLPGDREILFLPPRIDVTVRAGIKQLAALQRGDLKATASYTHILADSTGTVQVDVDCPQGVQLVARQPERVQYVVRKPS